MNNNLLRVSTLGALAATGIVGHAQSADALIDKLVDKGILSSDEANDLRDEADKGFTTAYQVKSGMSDWVHAIKINGDFRGRIEGFYGDPQPHPGSALNDDFVDRTRFRYRLRLGIVATLRENFEIGLRLGSGDIDNAAGLSSGIDPISTNQSLQNNASKKGIFLDQAYAKWSMLRGPEWSGVLTFGKMENPLVFSDMVFDADYTPEGLSYQLGYTLSDKHALKLNAGAFVLDELGGSSNDPYFGAAQVRWDAVWSPKISTTAGVAALGIANEEQLSNTAVPNINRGNSRGTRDGIANTLLNNYNPIVVDAAVTWHLESFPLYPTTFPIKLAGDYMNNPGASDNNSAYSVGVTFGKSGKKKTWDVMYTYKYLEGDAWYEEMVDSDFGAYYQNPTPAGGSAGYQSGTNVKGHIVRFAYSPYDFLTLSAKAFFTELINPSPLDADSAMTRLQVDAQFKF